MVAMDIHVARVTTPDSIISKAIAHLSDSQLVVTDRRGRELLRIETEQTVADGSYHYGDTMVEVMDTCGCGGTRIDPR